MEYKKLCDMNLSTRVLGTEGYGERIDEKTAFSIMNFFVENGGNIIDTARMYNGGKSESVVGEFIRPIRDKIYISTKCSHPDSFEELDKSRLEREDIISDLENSLKTLKVDYVDILWLHRDDVSKPVGPMIDALNELIRAGKVRYIGASNWSFDRIMEANSYAKSTSQTGFCASQGLYNLATRNRYWDYLLSYIDEEKEKYDNGKLPVFAFSSQAKGFFEKYAEGLLSEKAKDRYLNEKSVAVYNDIKKRAEEENVSISYMALKMLEEQSKFDVFPIIGPSKLSQLKCTMNIE